MSRYAIVSIAFLVLFISSLLVDGLIQIPFNWYVVLIVLYLAINTYGSIVLSMQYFVAVKYKGHPAENAIAITFDDGPVPGNTSRVLDILKAQHVSGAFFCIGNRAHNNPSLLQRIHAEGHVIGNHSYWHGKTFDLLSTNRVLQELSDTNQVIKKLIGLEPKFFRPPYGVTNPMIARAVARKNLTVVGWSIRSFDTIITDRHKLLDRVTRQLKAGDIILFHDYSETMLEILPEFLDHVKQLGLKIVRVDELLNEKAYR
jgi:peptidoglycan-N-acetylglucosamine deacetylase